MEKPIRKRPALTLRTQILGFLLGVGVIVVSIFIFLVLPRMLAAVDRILVRETQHELQTVSDSLLPYLIQNQFAAIHENLDELRKRKPAWRGMALLGEGGRRLYPLRPETFPAELRLESFTNEIHFRNTTLARLTVQVDFSEDRARVRAQAVSFIWIFTGVFIAALLLVAIFLELIVSRRVRSLSRVADQLAQRDYSTPLPRAGSDEIGDLVRSFAAMRDSVHDYETASRLAEESLRHLNDTLEQSVQSETARRMTQERLLIQQSRLAAMGEMIGNIAHQWRQPINTLSILLSNILDAHDFNDLSREYLEHQVSLGQDLIQKMSYTIDDFRNFFKPNKEKVGFNACDAIEEAIKMVSESFKSNNIEISFEKSGASFDVTGYPNEFAQVVLNALSNAKDVLIGKEISGKLRIHAEQHADNVTISIRDNGGGVPADILPKVFDPYFTTKEKGTGIGLYMSKMIMDNMGGDILIRNVADGAEVQLTLPQVGPAV